MRRASLRKSSTTPRGDRRRIWCSTSIPTTVETAGRRVAREALTRTGESRTSFKILRTAALTSRGRRKKILFASPTERIAGDGTVGRDVRRSLGLTPVRDRSTPSIGLRAGSHTASGSSPAQANRHCGRRPPHAYCGVGSPAWSSLTVGDATRLSRRVSIPRESPHAIALSSWSLDEPQGRHRDRLRSSNAGGAVGARARRLNAGAVGRSRLTGGP